MSCVELLFRKWKALNISIRVMVKFHCGKQSTNTKQVPATKSLLSAQLINAIYFILWWVNNGIILTNFFQGKQNRPPTSCSSVPLLSPAVTAAKRPCCRLRHLTSGHASNPLLFLLVNKSFGKYQVKLLRILIGDRGDILPTHGLYIFKTNAPS